MRTNVLHPQFIDIEASSDRDVYLSRVTSLDKESLYRDIVADDRERLAELGFPTEYADVSSMVDSLMEQMETGNILAYAIERMYGQDIDAFSITHGLIVLASFQDETREATMGYLMGNHSRVINRGYATAAASALANYAFENLGVESITVPSSGGRPASVHVAQMLGASIIDGSYVLDNGQAKIS